MTATANNAAGAITRVVPVNGLLVDAELWAAAHDYHRLHAQRHNMMMHGAGIAGGLETVAHEPANRTLIIYPGLALDPIGNVIYLPECERYTIQTDQPGPIYIVLQFREVAAGNRGMSAAGTPTHLREAYRIVESRTPVTEPHVELARIWLTGGRDGIVNAPDAFAPGPNQIDLRHRVEAGGLMRGEITVAQAWLDTMPAPIHSGLPVRLVQAVRDTTGYRARFIGQVAPKEVVGGCSVLYLASQGALALSSGDVEGLKAFVEAGGTVVGDGCHDSADDGFRETFAQLAQHLGRPLAALDRAAGVLRAPNAFGGPPAGSAPGDVQVADGLVYCGGDFGCATDGGQTKKPMPRGAIRDVTDLLVNVAIGAHQRRRGVTYAAERGAP